MKQSATVAVGVLALGAFVLYQRSQRTAAPAVDLSGTTDDLGVGMGPGGGLPAYRGLGHAWARTEPGEPGSAPDVDGSGGESADAGASVYANATASAGTEAGDTGASLTLGGAGGGGSRSPSTGGGGGLVSGSSQPHTSGGGITFQPPPVKGGK